MPKGLRWFVVTGAAAAACVVAACSAGTEGSAPDRGSDGRASDVALASSDATDVGPPPTDSRADGGGAAGDGSSDPCAGGGGCAPEATCTPGTGGSRTCSCQDGYAGDGLSCAFAVKLAIRPATPTVLVGRSLPLTAITSGTTHGDVSWSLTEPDGGGVDAAGLYTAPTTPGDYHVVATSVAFPQVAATATITVVEPPLPAVFAAPEDFSFPALANGFSFETLVDFDHDGDLDVLVAWGAWPPGPGMLQALRNDGTGHFADVSASVFSPSAPTPTHPRHFATADFNGDGYEDVFVADHGSDLPPYPGGQSLLLIGTPDGKLADETAARLPQVLAFTHDACAGDIDGDGDVDLYLSNIYNQGQVGPTVYRNDGTGHFGSDSAGLPPQIANLSDVFTACRLVDVDGDSDLDLVLGSDGGASASSPALLLNDGTGHFSHAVAGALPAPPSAAPIVVHIATADFDRDGWPDLLLTTTSMTPFYGVPCLQLLLNRGDGSFVDSSAAIPFSCASSNRWFVWFLPADFDGYGWPGFASGTVGPAGGDGAVLFGRGGGAGPQPGYTAAAGILPPDHVFDVLPGDLDGDGDTDLFVVRGGGSYSVVKNLGHP